MPKDRKMARIGSKERPTSPGRMKRKTPKSKRNLAAARERQLGGATGRFAKASTKKRAAAKAVKKPTKKKAVRGGIKKGTKKVGSKKVSKRPAKKTSKSRNARKR